MKFKGDWNQKQTEDFLAEARIPIRLAAVADSGYPVVISLWFYYAEGAFWSAVHKSSRMLKLLEANPKCAFEVATDVPPYKGVRGRAKAEVIPVHGPLILDYVITRYLGDGKSELAQWLLSRKADEVAIRLVPEHLNTWDFTSRMKGISNPNRM